MSSDEVCAGTPNSTKNCANHSVSTAGFKNSFNTLVMVDSDLFEPLRYLVMGGCWGFEIRRSVVKSTVQRTTRCRDTPKNSRVCRSTTLLPCVVLH